MFSSEQLSDSDSFKKEKFKHKEIKNQEDKKILELTNIEAYDFFLESSSYCNQIFPDYIDFSNILNKCKKLVSEKTLKDIINKNYPSDYDDVNYSIYHNKDGNIAWRQIQLINPILYVLCVKNLTEEKNLD